MIEIWVELARYKPTNQRLNDQVRKIIKKGWFSDFEIVEIHQLIYWETYQTTTTIGTETIIQKLTETSNLR